MKYSDEEYDSDKLFGYDSNSDAEGSETAIKGKNAAKGAR
jgi:hypothetical protein